MTQIFVLNWGGKIVGDCDKLVTWYKPQNCLKGLSSEEFTALPQSIIVREIYYYIIIPGFRTERVSLITTLLDTTVYSVVSQILVMLQKLFEDRKLLWLRI